jgi:uncharacterized membrane protein
MPTLDLTGQIAQPTAAVWSVLIDIEQYPEHMPGVREVLVLSEDGPRRVSRWTVLLKGSDFSWTEEETVDEANMRMDFRQTDGDLALYQGHYQLSTDGEQTRIDMHIEFDIGVPEMAAMLDAIAIESYRENFEETVDYLRSRALEAS